MELSTQEFVTTTSISTFAGATAAIYFVTNAFRILLKKNIPLLSFIVSLGMSYLLIYISRPNTLDIVTIILGFINGCMLFLSALGVQSSTSHFGETTTGTRTTTHSSSGVKWFSSWFN